MDNNEVYLICGVSGSGKTWVCRQLQEDYFYLPHDMHYEDFAKTVYEAATMQDRPIITECPFGERVLKDSLEAMGLTVHPYFVITEPEKVKSQYEGREGKPVPANVYTRASTIQDRAEEWDAFYGTAEEVLKELSVVKVLLDD